MRYLLLLVGLVFSLPGCGSGGSSGSSASLAKGKELYDLNCKVCHGAEGHGNGTPGIRDFAKHPWRTSPTPEAIKKSILEGVPGTTMPVIKSLSAADVDAIVAFTMTLTPKEPAPAPGPQGKAPEFEKFGFAAVQPAKLAPTLEFFDDKSQPLSLDASKGFWRVVHFWSKIGKAFESDLKTLQKLADEMKSIKFVVIGGDEHDPDAILEATEGVVSSLPLYAVKNHAGIERFEVKTLPLTLIVDPEGLLLARGEGKLEEEKLRVLLATIAK